MATAAPNFAQTWAQLVQCMEVFGDLEDALIGDFTTNVDTVQLGLDGEYAQGAIGVLRGVRNTLAGGLNARAAAYTPYIRELARVVKSNAGSVDGWIDDIHRYMIANNQTVNDRAWTRGTPTLVGGNTGDGAIERLTVTADNDNIQPGIATVQRFRVTEDENSGASENQAVFTAMTEGTVGDALFPRTATAGRQTFRTSAAEDAIANGFRNMHFSSYSSGGSVTTKFAGWTIGSAAGNVTEETGTVFNADRTGKSRAVKFTASETMSQKIGQGLKITSAYPRSTPWGAFLWWNRNGSAGTLRIRLGAATTTVVVSAQSGWEILSIVADVPQNCYPINMKEDELDFQIAWTQTDTDILVDNCWAGPLQRDLNGCWVNPYIGETGFLLEDEFLITDTVATDNVGEEFYLAFGRGVPSDASAGETIADY